jgi:hypothetical protein
MKGSPEICMQMPILAITDIKASDRFHSGDDNHKQLNARGDKK